MKILFYSHTGEVSGAENVLLLIIKKLNRSRFKPFAVCPSEGDLAEKFRELNVPCETVQTLNARFTWRIDLLFKYLLSFFQTMRELRKKALAENPDLIHANSIRAGLVATAATSRTKIPVFWHLQDELKTHPISTAIRLFVAFSNRVRLISASGATAESFYGKLLKTFDKKTPLKIVYNAIELDKFAFNSENRTKIRQEFNLSDSEFLLGIIGQITPRKGQLELVKNFADTLQENPVSTLLIVGKPMFNRDHEYLQKIKVLIQEKGLADRVKLLGQRSDIAAIMQAIDVLVINSKSEAFVVVGVEAMICGTPVIATDAGGTREMINHRDNGLIVQFGDDENLKKSIIELRSKPDLRKKFAKKAEAFARKNFNAEKFISDLEEFFAKPLSQKEFKNPRITRSAEVNEYV